MSAPIQKWRSPPTRAAEIGVESSKVLSWIAAGELIAVNIAERLGGRKRWRISDDAWQAFLESRSNVKSPEPASARRGRSKVDQPYY